MINKWILNTILLMGLFSWAGASAGQIKGKPPSLKGMVAIPQGKFTRGTEPDRANQICLKNSSVCKQAWFEDEAPIHSVQLESFHIDIHEVTQQEFSRVMGENPSEFEGANLPVERVTWYEAMDYCNKLGKRLPTEAQWEWAAKGGENSAFPWGENALSEKANFCDRQCPKRWRESQFEDGYRNTAPVGSFPANGYGVHDMAGNVYEWVQDWYDSDYYRVSPSDNPKGPAKGKRKVIRGGAWINYSVGVRPADRTDAKPKKRLNFVGFRCVM
jgi:sulfatase modifying factor 1